MVGEKDSGGRGSLEDGAQAAFNLGLPERKSAEDLAREERKELVGKANQVLLLFAQRVIPVLHEEVRLGRGRQVIASTQEGRPSEEQIGIDQPAENILKAAIRETHLPAVLVSEGTPEPTTFGNGGGEKVLIAIDPFDNSSPYKRGLDIPPYTVMSIWDKEGKPIGAVVGDIIRRRAYVAMDGQTFMWDFEQKILEEQAFAQRKERSLKDHIRLLQIKNKLTLLVPEQIKRLLEIDKQIAELKIMQPNQERSAESIETEQRMSQAKTEIINASLELKQFVENTKQIADIEDRAKREQAAFDESQRREPKRKPIERSERITLKNRESTLASFLGEKEYSLEFFKDFGVLVGNMDKKGYLYPGGGAFIYALLASGAIDAYVMRNEPLSEIIPGLPLALAVGCTVVTVHEDGTFKEFKFNPDDMIQNHKLYSEGVVPLFIAAARPEVRDEIIKHYTESKKERANQDTKGISLQSPPETQTT